VTEQKMQRSAFKQLTFLKTDPLQDMTMRAYLKLLRDVAAKPDETMKLLSCRSTSSSSSSCFSLDEPKRIMRDPSLSPAKSQRRNYFKNSFVQQLEIRQQKMKKQLNQQQQEIINIGDDPNTSVVKEEKDESKTQEDAKDTTTVTEPDQQQQHQKEEGQEMTATVDDDVDDEETNNNMDNALWSFEPRMFAIEKNKTGKRKYIVGHLGRLMNFYWNKLNSNQRHVYEVITENTPCNLYLDIEYSKITNSNISTKIEQLFCEELLSELLYEFSITYPNQFGKEYNTNNKLSSWKQEEAFWQSICS